MSVQALKRYKVEAARDRTASTHQRINASTIAIANRQRTKKFNSRVLKKIVSALLVELKIENAEMGINLVGAKEMARVNRQFLRHEGSTDVITFDHSEEQKAESRRQKIIQGELFVCVDDAVAQAVEFKTSWQSEMVRYIVHGVLHLLGHDDLKPALRRKMKRAENRLVRRLSGKFSFTEL